MTKRTCDGQDGFRAELIPPGSGVLCALSGGADSMYLLCRLLEGREAHGWTVQAAHLHHGLRVSAGRDEEMVRRWCAQRGVPLTVGHADAAAYARQQGMCVEEAGRTLRYAFLEDTARQEGLALIATGHHAGDDAETVLMNLIRGCGLKGLRVGGAQVSEKHAGFLINTGGATCKDIVELMEQVRERVFRETGVVLEPEVRYLGKEGEGWNF